ncbi:hypothetical protein, partial [Micromonospora sp.]|uniref:hypothetical protein n=1 Tax=Micromonospora sp. TaxID=1876 RepID=UPI003B3A5058
MKASTLARLDRDTPRWPEIRIDLTGDQPTVTIGGVITPVRDEHAALDVVAGQAAAHGRPVRARIADPDGLTRLIVDTTGAATTLTGPRTITPPAGATQPPTVFPRVPPQPGHTEPTATWPQPTPAADTKTDEPDDIPNDPANHTHNGWDPDDLIPADIDDGAGDAPIPAGSSKRVWRRRKGAAAKKKTSKKPAGRKGKGWRKLPPPVRWGAIGLGGLTLASAVVLIFHGGRHSSDEPAAPAVAPVPPAGQLYTETGPPGWTQQAAWTVQLAKDAPAPITTADGATIAVTAADGSANPQTGDTRYLSVLETDGRTRWATPLTSAPRVGPLLARVDGADVALIAGTRDLTYWPLTGGDPTVVSLPSGATVTPDGLIKLRDDQLGYLHAGTLAVVDELPRTEPAIAVDGAVIVTQADDGAWWTLRADAAPTVAKPAAPTGATGFKAFLAVGPDHVITVWSTADQRTCAVAAYATTDAATQATTTLPCASLPRPGAAYVSTGPIAGVG